MSIDGNGAGRHGRTDGAGRPEAVTQAGAELTGLVVAARAGDRQATDALLAAHLPMLYRIVGRALDGHADVDDVVQETVLRAHRDLPTLRTPANFRSWLVAIAMHQISSRLRSWQVHGERTAALDDAAQIPDPEAEFTDVTLLRLGLSEQRRQVAAAARWLDADDQELAELWWREVTGELTRADVAAALGIGAAHTRVRIQRMRNQLELSRFLVAALEAEPGCPVLDELARGWDGVPGPRWRKRFARHVRDCEICGAVRSGFVPLERLVLGAALVPLPATAGTAAVAGVVAGSVVTGGTTAGVGTAAGWLGQLVGAKVVTAVVVGATVSGGVYLALPDNPPGEPRGIASAEAPAVRQTPRTPSSRATPRPSRPAAATSASRPAASPSPAGLVPPGQAVIRPAGQTDTVVSLDGDAFVTATGVSPAVLTVVPGIADPSCVSMRSADGRYLRHASFRIVLHAVEDRELYRQDATFCPRPGAAAGTVRFVSQNYTDRFIRVLNGQLRLDPEEAGDVYEDESTFIVTGP